MKFLKPLPANASYRDAKTGIVLPSEGEIESSIPNSWDSTNPFEDMDSKNSFGRLNSSPDSLFYDQPRFTEHVDSNAVDIMTNFISTHVLKDGDEVLDLCSSWTSHINPQIVEKLRLKRITGLGMNAEELGRNNVLTDWNVVDLNDMARKKLHNNNENVLHILPYDDASYDVVLCQLSIDYLVQPLDIMTEIGRVLRPGGRVAILFSNRLFIEKAVGIWTGADDIDHAFTVGAYLHYSGGDFTNIKALDLSKRLTRGKMHPIEGDPMYAVTAMKANKA